MKKLNKFYINMPICIDPNQWEDDYRDFLCDVKNELGLEEDINSLSKLELVDIMTKIAPELCQLSIDIFGTTGYWRSEVIEKMYG